MARTTVVSHIPLANARGSEQLILSRDCEGAVVKRKAGHHTTVAHNALPWVFLAACSLACAQTNVLTVAAPAPLRVKAGATAAAKLTFQLRDGFHVNSNTPSVGYLIPLKLTWTGGVLTAGDVVYPKPQMERYSFSKVPLSVFTGDFTVLTRFQAAPGAPPGASTIAGKMRYQACNDRLCLPPRNLDVSLPVEIVR